MRSSAATSPCLVCLVSLVCARLLPADVTVGGSRPAVVQVPARYDPEVPIPLVVLLHGYGGDAASQEGYWRLASLAERVPFLCVRPNGTVDLSGSRFWNATDACCNFNGSAVDDSAYLRGLIEDIAGLFNLDRDRVCVAGLSNGGFMSYRMACDHADLVTAISSQAGAAFLDPSRCTPALPVSVLQIHGTADSVIGYNGGSSSVGAYPGAAASVAQWAAHNVCSPVRTATGETYELISGMPQMETVVSRFADGCPAGGAVELWTMQSADHVPPFVASGSTTVFAERVVGWLLSHPRRPGPTAAFTVAPPVGPAPLESAFDAGASTAPGGTALASFRWDFGDGAQGADAAASHTYAGPGRYIAKLRVLTDDQRVSLTTSAVVTAFCPGGDVSPWSAADVGAPAFRGSARLEPGLLGDPELVICAGGKPAGNTTSDEIFLVHVERSGDVRVTALVPRLDAASSVGVAVRADLDPGAPYAAMLLESQLGRVRYRFRYRTEPGVTSRSVTGVTLVEPAVWLRLERRGSVFTGLASRDGVAWTMVAEQAIEGMPAEVLAGLSAVGSDPGVGQPFTPPEVRISSLEAGSLVVEPAFRRGDANDDGVVDVSDGIFTLDYLFTGGGAPPCLDAADANDSGGEAPDLSDAIATFGFLFLGTDPELDPPGSRACGPDPTPDDLGCERGPSCP